MLNVNGYTSKATAIRAVNNVINQHGYNLASVLGQPESNAKLDKSPVRTFPLNLMPANSSGIMNTCPWKTAQCEELCLHTAGNPTHQPTKNKGRMARTYAYYYARDAFIAALTHDINNRINNSESAIAFRLNTTSDIPWEKQRININGVDILLMDQFKAVQFYDYTKSFAKALAYTNGKLPANYDIVFSLSENNDIEVSDILENGGKVAACVSYKTFPSILELKNRKAYPTYDADLSDYRPEDPRGTIGILKPKGKARDTKYLDGFVRVAG